MSGAQKENFEQYRKEMADWLVELKKSDEWKGAAYRVGMCHYGMVEDFCVKWPRETFGEILKDATPEGRLHLFLCGHTHRHLRKMPHSSDFTTFRHGGELPKPPKPQIDRKTKQPIPPRVWTNDYPFAEIELDSHDTVTIEATKEKLRFRAWDWRKSGETVDCYDALDITPDGKVTVEAGNAE